MATITWRVGRDSGCAKRPWIVMNSAGYELRQPKRGGGTMIRHWATEAAAKRVADKANAEQISN